MFVWGGCGELAGRTVYNPGDGGAGGNVGPAGKGVGELCGADGECRSGLLCDATSTCQPGHTLEAGQPCVISAECQDGLYCAAGACAPAGDGQDGDSCVTDADCGSGLRCAIVGLGAVCVPEGAVDLGGACTSSTDCYGGLACVDDQCAIMPPGVPPFGLPWGGVECEEEPKTPVVAHFRVPRGDEQDGDYFRLPHPNDVRLTDGKLDLTGFPTPGDGLLGFDIVQRYVDAVEADLDGWGMYQSVIFRFSGPLDLDSFDGAVKVVNLTDSKSMGYYFTYATNGGKYMCDYRVAVSRSRGQVWEPTKTYAVLLLDTMKADDKSDVQQAADLTALLGPSTPSDAALSLHYDKYASLRTYLSDNNIAPSTVLNASVFTIGSPRRYVEQLQGIIDAAAAPVASQWTLCDDGVSSPCPDAEGPRACPPAAASFHELHALVEIPIFQEGTAPYLDPADGGNLKVDNSTVEVARTEQVCLSLTVPKAVMPAAGWPTVVFAHGTGGSFRSHVLSKLSEDFAMGVSDGQGNTIKAAVLGIDQAQHGPRRNGSTKSPNDLFFNFSNPKAALGNVQQGAADQMALLRFVPTVAFDGSSPTAEPFKLSSTAIAYWGHSQGATVGAVATPYGSYRGVVMSGQGASLKDALISKSSPVNIAAVVPLVLSDFTSEGKLPHGNRHVVLNLMQQYIDGADPIAYARLIAVNPPQNVAAHHLMQAYGLSDTFTPAVVQATFALAAGVGLAAHDSSVSSPDEIGKLMPTATPATGNLKVDDKAVTAFVRQYAPSGSADGHFVAFDVPNARADVERFLAGALSGVTPQVGQ